MTILRNHYGLPATFSVGTLALMVDEEKANVVVYERQVAEEWVCDDEGFHAWVKCNGCSQHPPPMERSEVRHRLDQENHAGGLAEYDKLVVGPDQAALTALGPP